MIEAYAVGCALKFTDAVTAPLDRLTKKFEAFDVVIGKTNSGLAALGKNTAALTALSDEFLVLTRNAKAFAAEIPAFSAMTSEMRALGLVAAGAGRHMAGATLRSRQFAAGLAGASAKAGALRGTMLQLGAGRIPAVTASAGSLRVQFEALDPAVGKVNAKLAIMAGHVDTVAALSTEIAVLTRNMKAFALEVPSLKAMATAMKDIGLSATATGKEIQAATVRSTQFTAGLNGATASATRLEAAMGRVAAIRLPSAAGMIPALARPAAGRRAGGRAGGTGGGHGGLHVGAAGVGISSATVGLGGAMLPLAAGAAGLYGVHSLYEAAKDYEMALTRFKTLNLGDSINKDADAFARGSHQFGVGMTERMTVLRDLHEIMGDFREAKELTPLFTEMIFANRAVYGEEGAKFDHRQTQSLGKVLEMRGAASSVTEARGQAEWAQKAITGAAGMLSPADFLAFAKTGGVATRLLSNKAFWAESAPMMQEMSGTRYGTALMSAHQNLAMGRGSLQAMKEAVRIGLIDSKMIEYTKIGTIKRVLPGALKNDELYGASKFQYLIDVMIPAIRAAGVKGAGGKMVTGDNITGMQMVNELNYLFSQRTASNAFAQMYLQRDKVRKNIVITENAMGLEQITTLAKNTPQGVEDEFSAAWRDLKTEFGKGIAPQVTSLLKHTAELFRTLEHLKASDSPFLKLAEGMFNPAGFFTGYVREHLPGMGGGSPSVMTGYGQGGAYAEPQHRAPIDGRGLKVVMDGREVGRLVSKNMSNEMGSLTGTGAFDPSVSAAHAGLAFPR